MMTAEGRIVVIRGQQAQIRIQPPSACGSCRTRSACGTGGERLLWVDLATDARVGDWVEMRMPTAALNRAALVAYLLPAVTTLAAAALAAPAGDAVAAGAAGVGLAIGLVLMRILGHRLAAKAAPQACVPPHSSVSTGGLS